MSDKKVLYAIVAFFGVVILFYFGTMAMNQLCVMNQDHIHDPQWLEKSDQLCQIFTSLAQLIKQVIHF